MHVPVHKTLLIEVSRVVPQPLLAWLLAIMALAATAASWVLVPDNGFPASTAQILLALCLSASIIVGDMNPVHVNYHTKVSVSTVSLYLTAVLLPPPVAALTVGLSILAAEMLQPAKGNYLSDTVTCTSRWVLTIIVASSVAFWAVNGNLPSGPMLIGVAAVMYICDTLTSGLELGPIVNERPSHIAIETIRATWQVDLVLYQMGIIAALVAFAHTWALLLLVAPVYTVYIAFKHTKEMRDSTRELLEGMADAVDLRDPYTGGHSRRVTAFTERILQELDLTGPDVDLIVTAARVHDIGKIGIPDSVLHKTGKLTPEEWTVMESHSNRGAEILARYSDFDRGVGIVRHHHERWDGKGYPDKLNGLNTPFGARVIAVADSYDAMTSDRPYRKGMSKAKAAQILREGRGTQWDAVIVDALLRSIADELAEEAVAADKLDAGRTHLVNLDSIA